MNNKVYTLNDFSKIKMNATITEAQGRSAEINTSSILTKLIQSAGRFCESYASDLFISWNSMLRDMERGELKETYLFGMREAGVDHDKFILHRYNQNDISAHYEYRQMWRLYTNVDENGWITMCLYEIQIP